MRAWVCGAMAFGVGVPSALAQDNRPDPDRIWELLLLERVANYTEIMMWTGIAAAIAATGGVIALFLTFRWQRALVQNQERGLLTPIGGEVEWVRVEADPSRAQYEPGYIAYIELALQNVGRTQVTELKGEFTVAASCHTDSMIDIDERKYRGSAQVINAGGYVLMYIRPRGSLPFADRMPDMVQVRGTITYQDFSGNKQHHYMIAMGLAPDRTNTVPLAFTVEEDRIQKYLGKKHRYVFDTDRYP